MAFKHANNSEESVRRLYTGVGVAKVIAVNPTKAEMEQIYGTTIQNEPVYAGTTRSGEKQMRVSFVLSVNINEEKPMLTTVTFFVNDTFMKGTTSGKYQVIDKYGRTAWATQEEIDANKIPQYSNGPARIDKSYRKAYSGEVQLEQFIRALLCLDDPEYWNSNTSSWVTRTGKELEMCDGILEDVKAIINGDISELKECVSLGKNNEVKVLFGVRNNNDGRQYQAVFTDLFVRNKSRMETAINQFESKLDDRIKNGGYKTTEFDVAPIHEYKVVPTSFATEEAKPEVPATDVPEDMPEEFPELEC